MATGEAVPSRGDWTNTAPGYHGQGLRRSNFHMWIDGGQQVNIRDTEDVYVEMQDGEPYAVWVANRSRLTVEVDLHIDGCLFKPRCREIVIRFKGHTRKIFAPESYTVLDLKQHIDRLEHIAPDQQDLWLVDGVISLRLEDEKTLSSYQIIDNSVIDCHTPRFSINVLLPNKEIVLLMLFSDTVLDLKKRIQEIEPDLPPEKQNLFIGTNNVIKLEDVQLLSHYMYMENDECRHQVIKCNPPHPKRHELIIKTQTNNTITIEIYNHVNSTSVLCLKQHILAKEGIPVNEQRLVFGGRQLVDDRMLSDYKIEHKSTIHLIIQLRGGGGGDPVTMSGPDEHWTRGSTRLTNISDQTFAKRVDDDIKYDASAGEELKIKLVGKDTYSHSESL